MRARYPLDPCAPAHVPYRVACGAPTGICENSEALVKDREGVVEPVNNDN
jgi:hypothetical protein